MFLVRSASTVVMGVLFAAGVACKSSPEGQARPMPTAAAEPTAEQKGSAVAEDAAYSVRLLAPDSLIVGRPALVTLTLTAKEPFHCNQEYPYKFTLDPTDGLRTPVSPITTGVKLEESRATLQIEVIPERAGTHTLSGLFAFSVCTDEKCLIERSKLAVELTAADAS